MRILLIEDDTLLADSLRASLAQSGFAVTVCADGEDGLFHMLDNAADVVLLDRMLPELDGLRLLERARKAGCRTPVIFLTALGSLADRIEGLNAGADDYLVKPFSYDELLARIRAVLRRPPSLCDEQVMTFADITFDPGQLLLFCGAKRCTLSVREGDLLRLFMTDPGITLPRSVLINRVWGADSEIESGNLDNYIHFLRRRLRSVNARVRLMTHRGVGYRLTDPGVSESARDALPALPDIACEEAIR